MEHKDQLPMQVNQGCTQDLHAGVKEQWDDDPTGIRSLRCGPQLPLLVRLTEMPPWVSHEQYSDCKI